LGEQTKKEEETMPPRKPRYLEETFEHWHFTEPGVLCSPEGDRFNPLQIRMCHFLKQSREFSHLLHWRPSMEGDQVIYDFAELVRRGDFQTGRLTAQADYSESP
jgi:hypothetical protein